MDKPIIVGYDGSPNSVLAVQWAARSAAGRHLDLRLVKAWTRPSEDVTAGITEWKNDYENGLRAESQDALAGGIQLARTIDPDISISGETLRGLAADTLIEQSRGAAAMVLGSPDVRGFLGRLAGSVARQVVPHIACPVIVVRSAANPDSREVVVGVDGSPSSLRALEFSVEEASFRGCHVKLLHTWQLPPFGGITDSPVFAPPQMLEEIAGDEMRLVSKELTRLHEQHPHIGVSEYVMRGSATEALQAASQDAALIVVGSRGRGGFRSLLQGSVSLAVTYAAECSVAVVH